MLLYVLLLDLVLSASVGLTNEESKSAATASSSRSLNVLHHSWFHDNPKASGTKWEKHHGDKHYNTHEPEAPTSPHVHYPTSWHAPAVAPVMYYYGKGKGKGHKKHKKSKSSKDSGYYYHHYPWPSAPTWHEPAAPASAPTWAGAPHWWPSAPAAKPTPIFSSRSKSKKSKKGSKKDKQGKSKGHYYKHPKGKGGKPIPAWPTYPSKPAPEYPTYPSKPAPAWPTEPSKPTPMWPWPTAPSKPYPTAPSKPYPTWHWKPTPWQWKPTPHWKPSPSAPYAKPVAIIETRKPTPRPVPPAPTDAPVVAPPIVPRPTPGPPVSGPTLAPTTSAPTPSPLGTPPAGTPSPTDAPSSEPSFVPSLLPSSSDTPEPTASPTSAGTPEPTTEPTASPVSVDTPEPTPEPTTSPVSVDTPEPTTEPTTSPVSTGTPQPTTEPTTSPVSAGTPEPTLEPTASPVGGGGGETLEPTASPVGGGGGETLEPTASPVDGGGGETLEPTASPVVGGTTPEPTASPVVGGTTPEPTASPTSSPTLTVDSDATMEPTPGPSPTTTNTTFAPDATPNVNSTVQPKTPPSVNNEPTSMAVDPAPQPPPPPTNNPPTGGAAGTKVSRTVQSVPFYARFIGDFNVTQDEVIIRDTIQVLYYDFLKDAIGPILTSVNVVIDYRESDHTDNTRHLLLRHLGETVAVAEIAATIRLTGYDVSVLAAFDNDQATESLKSFLRGESLRELYDELVAAGVNITSIQVEQQEGGKEVIVSGEGGNRLGGNPARGQMTALVAATVSGAVVFVSLLGLLVVNRRRIQRTFRPQDEFDEVSSIGSCDRTIQSSNINNQGKQDASTRNAETASLTYSTTDSIENVAFPNLLNPKPQRVDDRSSSSSGSRSSSSSSSYSGNSSNSSTMRMWDGPDLVASVGSLSGKSWSVDGRTTYRSEPAKVKKARKSWRKEIDEEDLEDVYLAPVSLL